MVGFQRLYWASTVHRQNSLHAAVVCAARGRPIDVPDGVSGPVNPSDTERSPGWYGVGDNPNHQSYWTGTEWSGQRRWSAGVGWREVHEPVGDLERGSPDGDRASTRRRGGVGILGKPWILSTVGVALIVIGWGGGHIARTQNNLPGLVVNAPASGMIATATGDGSGQPSEVLSGAYRLTGLRKSAAVFPTTPTIFLPPLVLTNFGIKTGTEAAYWKVWWSASRQVKGVVSLQQDTYSSSADTELKNLTGQIGNTANFNSASIRFTRFTSFALPGIPGAAGYLWEGIEHPANVPLPIEFRFAMFDRNSVVALVSMTAYRRTTDLNAFLAFAYSEYASMSAQSDIAAEAALFALVGLCGFGLVTFGIVLVVRNRRKRSKDAPGQRRWAVTQPPQAARGAPQAGHLV